MTVKTILVQVRMPEKLVRTIDALQEEGIYTSRTEVILDSVRRLVMAFQTNDPIKQSVARSLHGKAGSGSFRDIAQEYNPDDIVLALSEAYKTDSIDAIIDEVRR